MVVNIIFLRFLWLPSIASNSR